jgi:endoglycosylceramidase
MYSSKTLKKWTLAVAVLGAVSSAWARDMSFDQHPALGAITIGSKTYGEGPVQVTDKVFKDGLGREVVLRGWNVGAAAKLMSEGRQNYRSVADAQEDFDDIAAHSGANFVRFLIEWDAFNPDVRVIDYQYLDKSISYFREALRRRIHVKLAIDKCLWSRAVFTKASKHTATGAPSYVVRDAYAGTFPNCPLGLCTFWGMEYVFNLGVRGSEADFWDNSLLLNKRTGWRPIRVQDEYHWAMGKALSYIKSKLTQEEFDYLLGFDPLNEPANKSLGRDPSWDDAKLWPFYQRVRKVMDDSGWGDKANYAGPNVAWNAEYSLDIGLGGSKYLLPFGPPPGMHFKAKPGVRHVFNAHFYDLPRTMGADKTKPSHGEYFDEGDRIRNAGRAWGSAIIMSEIGDPIGHILGNPNLPIHDPSYHLSYMYQAMDGAPQQKGGRYLAAYAPVVSTGQWVWNKYYNRCREEVNGNPANVNAEGDCFGQEKFSVVDYSNGTFRWTYDPFVSVRPYPRAVQGSIMNFHVNALPRNLDGAVVMKTAIRPIGVAASNYFEDNRFALLTWRGKNSTAPTELYIPEIYGTDLAVITDREIRVLNGVDANANAAPGSISLLRDRVVVAGKSGSRLLIWDDVSPLGEQSQWHYALLVQRKAGEAWSPALLASVQQALNNAIVAQRRNPVYLLGDLSTRN